MKKLIIYFLAATLLITTFCTTVCADTSEFIEQCRNNYTYILAEDSVEVNGFENLWDDRTIITEEDLTYAENYNSENEEAMRYALKLKINYIEPFIKIGAIDSNGVEYTNIFPNSMISEDASLSAICTDANYQAHSGIESADSYWYVVSIEKYDVHGEEHLIAAACTSDEQYNISFPIPSKYSECTDLKLARIMDGQVSYVSDMDSDNTTYTISATGSAAYVFVGTMNPANVIPGTADEDIGTIEPTFTTKPEADLGQAVAPQTSDSNDIMKVTILLLTSAIAVIGMATKRKA